MAVSRAADGSRARRLPQWVFIGGRLVGFGLIAFLLVRLGLLWRAHPLDIGRSQPGLLVAGFACTTAAVVAPAFVWILILHGLAVEAPRAWIWLYFRAQLGKYLPGGVWQYAGRAALLRVRGVPLSSATLSLVVEFVAGSAAAGLIGLVVFEPWSIAALVPVGGAVAVGRRLWLIPLSRWSSRRFRIRDRSLSPEEITATLLTGAKAACLYAPLWFVHGASVWLIARALFGAPAAGLLFYTGAFALSWLAGLAAVFAPGGIGVRESVLAAFLAPRLGAADAIVVAVASRMFFAAVDVFAGGTALLMRRVPGVASVDRGVGGTS